VPDIAGKALNGSPCIVKMCKNAQFKRRLKVKLGKQKQNGNCCLVASLEVGFSSCQFKKI
jgi:hypothetical protein